MNTITLILPYYDNPGMLTRQCEDLLALPSATRDLVSLIVVDDCSPNHPAVLPDMQGMSVQLYRLLKDVRWNQDACRNIGVSHSETNWMLLTDIDHLTPVVTWERLTSREYDGDKVYQFRRKSLPLMDDYKLHPNSWFITKKKYEQIGGYDERFAGYYGTDSEFRERVRKVAGDIVMLKEHLIRVPRSVIPDASTTSYLRKQPQDGPAIARIKEKRNRNPDWVPQRGRFEYVRVYP